MVPVKQVSSAALAAVLRRQPICPAKLRFAWELAAGRPMGRAAEPALGPEGVFVLQVTDAHWAREIARARPVLLERLRALLGPDSVVRLDVRVP